MTALAQLAAVLLLPWLVVGVIQRTRALWSGRRGPPLLQSAFDVVRLLRKTPVYSTTTTAVFRITPWIGLATTLATAAIVPILGVPPLVSFPFDFVWLAYAWALGRVATMLGALDTGSAFEGMGASREATYAALVEPALFLVMGSLCALSGSSSLAGALDVPLSNGASLVVWAASLVALVIIVQAEGARMPVDDPTTHLELTMIHEVMVLDHSGPDLAAIQAAAALKLTLGVALLAALTNPWLGSTHPGAALWNLGAIGALAIAIGTVESLVARLKLRHLPRYFFAAAVAGVLALLATTWQGAP